MRYTNSSLVQNIWQSRGIQVPEGEEAYPELMQFGPTPYNGLFVRHIRNLELAHVEFAPANPDPRPALYFEDAHRVDLFAITAPPQPNVTLRNVTDLRAAWSRAVPDITLAAAKDQTL